MINELIAQNGVRCAYPHLKSHDIDNETIFYDAAESFEEMQHIDMDQNNKIILAQNATEKTSHEITDTFNFCSGAITNFCSGNANNSSQQSNIQNISPTTFSHILVPSTMDFNSQREKDIKINNDSARPIKNMNNSFQVHKDCSGKEKMILGNISNDNYNMYSFSSTVRNLHLNDTPTSVTDREKKIETKFDFKEDEISMNYLKNQLRTIPVKCRQTSLENRHCRTLLEIQNFYIDYEEIWVIKLSEDGRYLATGGKKGTLQIFQICASREECYKTTSNIISSLNFISETPYRTYNEHSKDITDISWCQNYCNLLITASTDHFAILWDINSQVSVSRYEHNDMVSCVSFCPGVKEGEVIFVSGCLDKYVRIWNMSISQSNQPEYFNIKDKITAISFFPNGESIAVGTHNGKIFIYDLKFKLRYNCSFACKNRLGKFSKGRKVTNIEFANRTSAFITTGDSRIRLVSIPEGKLIHKYKGHKNENSMIRAHNEETYDLLISASEDGYCYIWNKLNKENNDKKNYSYEYFKPFAKEVTLCSIFASDNCTAMYLKKLFKITTNIFVFSIIINATARGRLQVLLNCEEISN